MSSDKDFADYPLLYKDINFLVFLETILHVSQWSFPVWCTSEGVFLIQSKKNVKNFPKMSLSASLAFILITVFSQLHILCMRHTHMCFVVCCCCCF